LADYDVIVVGAGIMGMASAYYIKLNNPTKEVLVIDRLPAAGQGNTGRSNAMFRNTFSSSDNQILANSSIDFYLHVQSEMKVDIGLQQIGYLWMMSEKQLSSSERFLNAMQENKVEISVFDARVLKMKLPGLVAAFSSSESSVMGLPDIEAGVFGPKCGRLDPDKLVRFYAKRFSELGGKVSFNTNVESLVVGPKKRLGVDGEPFVWQDSEIEGLRASGSIDGVLRAETVVLACGAWGNELLEPIGIDGRVKAKKRQLFSISAQGSSELQSLIHSKGFNPLALLPMVILPKSGVHFKPVIEENALWVACEDEVNRPYIDVPARELSAYQAELAYYERSVKPVLSAYFPSFRNARIKAMWAGLYSYNTLDFLPFVFREKNLIIAGGDSGSGIMKGDSLGRVVDAEYRGLDEAELFGGSHYKVSRIGFDKREAEKEKWVI
jgi:FAD-dependent oxidoreductase domain-containing protein 1